MYSLYTHNNAGIANINNSLYGIIITFLCILTMDLQAQRSCIDLAESDEALLHYETIDLAFDGEGKPRYPGYVLDSIVSYRCDSLCDRKTNGTYFYYQNGRVDVIINGNYAKVEYDSSSFKINQEIPVGEEYHTTYKFKNDLLEEYRYYRGETLDAVSTLSGHTRITRRADDKISFTSSSRDYAGGFTTSSDSRSTYSYNGDTLTAIETWESSFASGTEPSSGSTLLEYAYLQDEIIVREDSILNSKYTCVSDEDSENLVEFYYKYDNGDWVLQSTTTFTKKLLPLTIQKYSLGNPFTLKKYFYSTEITEIVDLDGDGYYGIYDCDETNPDVNKGQTEIPYNGLDDDCTSWTLDDDLDQDGYPLSEDCDDTKPYIYPGAVDYPHNDVDEDCDGIPNIVPGIHFLSDFYTYQGELVYPALYDTVCTNRRFPVVFNDIQDYVSYNWNFGSSASLQDATGAGTHWLSISEAGHKEISVEVIDSSGQATTYTSSMFVQAQHLADWSYDKISQTEIQFTSEADPAIEYHWEFGDGNTSMEPNPTHNYANPGDYEVLLQVAETDYCFRQRKTKQIFTKPIIPDTIVTSICTQESMSFYYPVEAAPCTFSWNFGNNSNPSIAASAGPHEVHYSKGGHKAVKLRLRCNDEVYELEDSIYIMGAPDGQWTHQVLDDLEVQFSAELEPTENYYWDFGDGNNSILENPIHSYSQTGTYEVSLLAANKCDSTEVAQDLIITSTSTFDPNINSKILIYPNPTSGILNLSSSQEQEVQMEILDTSGKVCWTDTMTIGGTPELDLRHLPAGAYQLRIMSEKEISLHSFSVIK